MTQFINSLTQAASFVDIEDLDLSIRTYNRLRGMKIKNLDQIAQTPPKQFLAIKGFGMTCLGEIAKTLEMFYSSLEVSRLVALADMIELWRPYFQHPERVPVVTINSDSPTPYQLATDDRGQRVVEPIERFDPAQHPKAQLLIQDLPISTRARHILKIAKIRTLNDLAKKNPQAILALQNCGRTTIAELSILLTEYFATLPTSGAVFYRNTRPSWLSHGRASGPDEKRLGSMFLLEPEAQSAVKIIETGLTSLGDRSIAILTKRMGLSRGQSRKTLEAIGREFHLTRERVRQIVEASLKFILRHLKIRRPDVFPTILNLIRAKDVASLDEIMAAIQNFGTSTVFDERAAVRMLLVADRREVHHLDAAGNLWGAKDVTLEFNEKVMKAAGAVLKGIPMSCEHLSVEVAKSLGQFEDRKIKIIQKLLLNPSNKFRIEVSADGATLYPPRQTSLDRRRAFIYSYIKEQGVPVHIQEIFSAIQDSEPELIPDSPTRRSAIHAITSSIDRDDRFAWAGISTWGLREWGYVSRGNSVAAAAIAILRASDVPLSTAQIRKELSHLYRVSPGAISAALKASKGVAVERNAQGLWLSI